MTIGQITLSLLIFVVVVFVGWRIVTAKFRVTLYYLMRDHLWVQINESISYFRLRTEGNVCKISSFGKDDNMFILDYPIEYIKGVVINHRMLFDWENISDTVRVARPNSDFIEAANAIKADMIATSKRLHEKFDNYPKWIQSRLQGAYDILNELDEKLAA